MPPAPLLKLKPMHSLPPNEIPPPPSRLIPTKEDDRALSPLPVPPPPTEVPQFKEPASLGAGGRDGRDSPTRHRGKIDGGGTRSKRAVPMEKEGSGARPARPRGGSPPGGGDLGWKATRESPRRPRGAGWRSSSPCCGGAIGWRRKEDERRLFV